MERNRDKLPVLSTMSRRGFFTLAAALGLTAATEGLEGLFVRAWADEADTTSYKIYVARRWEIPVCFLDESDPADPRSVVGATVTVTSLHNGKTATGTTDSLGVAVLDISELAEDDPYVDSTIVRTDYSFYGTLHVAAEGFRTYETGKLRMRGGEQADAPTKPLDGKPYVQRATINGWDIRSSASTTFVSTASDPATPHKAVVKVAGGAGSASAKLFQKGGVSHEGSAAFDSQGVACVEIDGQFFSKSAENKGSAFAEGEPILLALASSASASEELTTSATSKPATIDEPLTEESDGCDGGRLSATSFLLESDSINLIPIPSGFPVLGNDNFNFESIFPTFPVSLAVDPTGYIVAGVGYSGSLHRRGSRDGMWQHDTFEDVKNEYRRTKEEWKDGFEKFKDEREWAQLLGDKAPKTGKLAPTKKFEMGFQCGGMLHMEFGEHLEGSDDKYAGDVQLYAIVSGEASYTRQFIVMYVPLFVNFRFSAAARATIDVGVGVTRDGGKLHLGDDTSFSLSIKPEMSATLGVGVADLLSVGVRGSGYLSGFMGVFALLPEGKPNPRLSLDGGANVSVVLQVVLFKGSFNLYSFDANIADNWATDGSSLLKAASDGEGAPGNLSAYYVGEGGYGLPGPLMVEDGLLRSGEKTKSFAQSAVPVTQAQLAASAEFAATPKASPALLQGNGEGEAGTDEAPAAEPSHDLYDYAPVARRVRSMGEASSKLQALGANGAAVTGSTVHEDAFSDPRMKVVSVNGEPWMLRILTVNYGTDESPKMRTRLSVAKWAYDAGAGQALSEGRWGSAQVVDFSPVYDATEAPSREDLYDYDFAVLSASDAEGLNASSWADGGVVRVFLTSGTRGDATSTVGAALSHTVGTFLSLAEDGSGGFTVKTARSFLDTYASSSASDKVTSDKVIETFKTLEPACSTLVYPSVIHAVDETKGSVTAVFGFCRIAAKPDDLISGPYQEFPATAFFDSNGNSLTGRNTFSVAGWAQGEEKHFRAILSDVKTSVSTGILRTNIAGNNQFAIGCHYITQGNTGAGSLKSFALLRNANRVNDQNDPGNILPLGACANLGANPRFVYPWPAKGPGGALCATEEGLHACAFTFGASATSAPDGVSATPLSLDNDISLSSFALDPYSEMLYFSTVRDGVEAGELQLDGSRGEGATVCDYRIWATRCISVGGENGFMKPFPLIQADQPVDSLTYLDLGDSYGFMANSMTDMTTSTSRIVLFNIPYLQRITLLGFESVNRYVCAGETEAFRVMVRNDGNLSVSSFTIEIGIDGATYDVTLDLTDTDNVIPIPSVYDAAAVSTASEDGLAPAEDDDSGAAVPNSQVTGTTLDLATRAGLLNPGITRTFQFMWKVPENLAGETDVAVTVVEDGDAASGGQSGSGVAQGESSRFRNNARFASSENIGIAPSTLSASALFRAPIAEIGGEDGEPDGETDGEGATPSPSTPENAIPGESGALSNTGDDLPTAATAALVAGLGLAGAGVAAHKLGGKEKFE